MKLLQVVVGNQGYRQPDGNPARHQLLDALLRVAAESRSDGIVLPAGFWTVKSPSQVAQLAESVQKRVGRCGIAVIAGIDVTMSTSANSTKRKTTLSADLEKRQDILRGRLPYYGFAIDSSGTLVTPFQQESRTARDARFARELVPEKRWVRIGGGKVVVLVCGEGHNDTYRQTLTEHPANAVIMIGHDGLGQGLVPTICCIARRTHTPVLHVQHLATMAGMHFADANAVNQPVSTRDNAQVPITEDGPWFAWVVRNIPVHWKASKNSKKPRTKPLHQSISI